MRAVIIATDHQFESAAFNYRLPSVMLPLVDRPFIQHVIEYLIDRKITDFDLILSHLPEKIEGFLGDGARWGSTFRYHLVRDPRRPYTVLRSIHLEDDEYILLVHADRLAQISAEHLELAAGRGKSFPFCYRNAADSANDLTWTGWACMPTGSLKEMSGDADEKEAATRLIEAARSEDSIIEIDPPLSVVSYAELLDSQLKVLTGQFSGLAVSGKEAEEGIWVSRNVSLDPTARLVAPVFIGENCRIARGIHLGPNAVIGGDCVLDSRCIVSNSLIMSGSYVGEALELSDVIVDKNRLVNVRVGAAVSISDAFILGSIQDTHFKRYFSGVFSRLTAALLLLVFWPALLLTALCLKLFRRGPVVHRTEALRLPTTTEKSEWRTFDLCSFVPGGSDAAGLRRLLLAFLPALINVAKGELRFVGVAPRTPAEIDGLPDDWKALYLRSKPGIVTEAFVNYGVTPTEDDLYTAEAFYAAAAGLKHDLKLLRRYFGRIPKDSISSPATRIVQEARVIPARVK
jgi:lipopolysaccharide/colanic/teichoic acid biosynthesis glycosyltransferase